MKRDMDLIRKILLKVEAESDGMEMVSTNIEGYSREVVAFHVMLLNEAGLITAIDFSSGDGLNYAPIRLTWQGYEFLDAARDDARWNKAKDVMNKAGGFVFEVAKALLIDLMKKQLLP